MVLISGSLLYYDIFIAMFVQTWAFVAFNKVQTAQYILWYKTILPIVFVNNALTKNKKF